MNILAVCAIGSVMAFGAGFGAAWKLQAANITQMQLENAHELIQQQADARDVYERNLAKVSAAQAGATTRAITLRRDAASAAFVGNGLRLKTDEAVAAARTDAALCAQSTATLGELLTTVSDERRALAETCDRHVIDIQALMDRQAQ